MMNPFIISPLVQGSLSLSFLWGRKIQNSPKAANYLRWILVGKEKAKKTQVKEFWRQRSPTISYIKTELQLRALILPAPPFLSNSDSRVYSDLLQECYDLEFSAGYNFFPFIHTASESRVWLVIEILVQLMSKLKLYFHNWNLPKQLFFKTRVKAPTLQT